MKLHHFLLTTIYTFAIISHGYANKTDALNVDDMGTSKNSRLHSCKKRNHTIAEQNRGLNSSPRKLAETFPFINYDTHTKTFTLVPTENKEVFDKDMLNFEVKEVYDKYNYLHLQWKIGKLQFEQYNDPQDSRITLSITDQEKEKTYYRQQRFLDSSEESLGDVYFDSKNQVEYWYDEGKKMNKWVVEHPKDFELETFNSRAEALKKVKDWGTSNSNPHIFNRPGILREYAEKDLTLVEKPSLWKAIPLGWLALSGDTMYGLRGSFARSAHGSSSVNDSTQNEEDSSSSIPSQCDLNSESLLGNSSIFSSSTKFLAAMMPSFVSSMNGFPKTGLLLATLSGMFTRPVSAERYVVAVSPQEADCGVKGRAVNAHVYLDQITCRRDITTWSDGHKDKGEWTRTANQVREIYRYEWGLTQIERNACGPNAPLSCIQQKHAQVVAQRFTQLKNPPQ